MRTANRRPLAFIIALKIVVTGVWIAGCWSDGLREGAGIPLPEPQLFFRLLGFAYAGLVVGYAIGWYQTWKNHRAAATVGAGIVSNGGSCLCLIAFIQVWREWPGWGPLVMSGSVVLLLIITGGLIVWGWRDLVDELKALGAM